MKQQLYVLGRGVHKSPAVIAHERRELRANIFAWFWLLAMMAMATVAACWGTP